MALFSKKTKSAQGGSASGRKETAGVSIKRSLAHVLEQARITEKATMHSEAGVYTFNVSDRATKRDIIQAVFALYKVTPRMVRVLRVPMKVKRNARTGKTGIKSGGKKAYVYLKKGESITLS